MGWWWALIGLVTYLALLALLLCFLAGAQKVSHN